MSDWLAKNKSNLLLTTFMFGLGYIFFAVLKRPCVCACLPLFIYVAYEYSEYYKNV